MRFRGQSLDIRHRYGDAGGVLFLTAPGSCAELANLVSDADSIPAAATDYGRLWFFRRFSAKAVVYCDVERLTAEQEDRLSALSRLWINDHPDLRILNCPPKAQRRYPLLKALFRAGVNKSDVHRVDEPDLFDKTRFPCFVRTENGHDFGGAPRLLHSKDDLRAELTAFAERGLTLYGKIVCEFEDTRCTEGHYAKYSYFKIGDWLAPAHRYAGDEWFLKGYKPHFIDKCPQSLDLEREFMERRLYRDDAEKAFAAAGVDYGRVDFAVRPDGGVHIFEVNTNPWHLRIDQIDPRRRDLARAVRRELVEGLKSLTTGRRVARLQWRRGAV